MKIEHASANGSRTLPVIGILGGMGPAATVDLMHRVIAETPARDDIDHIHMIVDNNPKVPSRIKALIEGGGSSPLPELRGMAQRLESAGANILAMPCNTAHYYYGEICDSITIPFLDMIGIVSRRILSGPLKHRRIGLLASVAVQKLGIYGRKLTPAGIGIVYTERSQDIMSVIRRVKSGDCSLAVREEYIEIAEQLTEQKLDYLVVACTELSALTPLGEDMPPTIDAMDLLVEEIIACGLGMKSVAGKTQVKKQRELRDSFRV